MYKFWSTEEIEYLKKLYEEDGLVLSELYPIFKNKYNRSKISVEVKIRKLKLKHTKEQISKAKSRLYKGEGNGMCGKKGPNKGLTKENSERIKSSAKKISKTRKEMYKNGKLIKPKGEKNPMYGVKAWNKGKTKYTDERIRKASIKMSVSRKEYWKSLTEEEQSEIIGNLTKYANMARKDTKIEFLIKKSLENLNIKFIKNYKKSRYIFDFYLPDYNCIIECQGDYWHANPEIYEESKYSDQQKNNVERDKRKKDYIYKNKFNSIFLWENYIHKYKNELDDILLEFLRDI